MKLFTEVEDIFLLYFSWEVIRSVATLRNYLLHLNQENITRYSCLRWFKHSEYIKLHYTISVKQQTYITPFIFIHLCFQIYLFLIQAAEMPERKESSSFWNQKKKWRKKKFKSQTTTTKVNQRRAKPYPFEDLSNVLLLSNNIQKNAICIIFLYLVNDKENKKKVLKDLFFIHL